MPKIRGTSANDRLVGTTGDDLLLGLGGGDVLNGAGGNDTIDGGSGTDLISFAPVGGTIGDPYGEGVNVALSTGLFNYTQTSSFYSGWVYNIENVLGSSGDDSITGNAIANLLNGAEGDDSISGLDGADTIIGGSGDDNMTGGSGRDVFIFAATKSQNGEDDIVDLQVKHSETSLKGADYDVLDLTVAIGKKISISNSNIDNYVWIEGNKLHVDPLGSHNGDVWATLENVVEGDQVRVKTGSFDGWITAKPGSAYDFYITIDKGGAWIDSNENGIKDGSEAYLTAGDFTASNGAYTINGIDIGSASVAIRYNDLNISGTSVLDLTGFGADDKVVIDADTNFSSWLGFSFLGGAATYTENGVNALYFSEYRPFSQQYGLFSYNSITQYVSGGKIQVYWHKVTTVNPANYYYQTGTVTVAKNFSGTIEYILPV